MSGNFGQQQFQRQQFGHKPSDMAKKDIDYDSIRARLKIPALGLLVTGLLSILIVIGGTAGGLIYGSTQTEQIVRDLTWRLFGVDELDESLLRRQQNSKKEKEAAIRRQNRANTAMTLLFGGAIIGALVLSSFYIVSVSGGMLMGQLRNYRLCKLACIMAMIPGISPLLVAGIPFGIIGFAKLKNPEIKKGFS